MSDVPNGVERLRAVDLGGVTPARSRHAGRRSAVELVDGLVIAGTAAGDVLAHDRTTLEERWRAGTATERTAVVSVESFGDGIAVGERGPDGAVRCYDVDTGELRWQYATATDVGWPQKPSRVFLPFVVDVTADGDRLYVASRRYERDGERSEPSGRASDEERTASRDGERRSFTSAVYAFDERGDVVWTRGTDASPISIDVDGRRLAVAYNRCPGTHQHGLVVLDAETGSVRWEWDPGTDGQRRVGDVSIVEGGVVVASHGDYCGYRLGDGGTEQWRVDLATPTTIDGETLYAYPNHVHATADGVVFVTGNTYSTDGRETESLHPREHTALGYTADGERVWTASVGGFVSELGVDGDRVAVPSAQHFRTRDVDVHGLRLFETERGVETSLETAGVVAAVALEGETVAAVEEPVVYYDDGTVRGNYRLLITTTALG
ncbi:PQQ-binding-like beta-propeller repeat protein [Halalkalicoccus sp. NIPERK01]|uniref:outer membrane protein assembly factor BamB family protein n=1 Tax=Halalkalicoccus sp. NIPERK01 TaxID=3053469 RepID=UPI00256F156F|nr:PQQ-binding-like beta-propeller repeat protein [Halalkalicoccus sp. NIPERK01]MDL5363115.1 PQQ-binding-like beta-propeller repeat protein [Halalkalicoccus sp. NIPERK01]